MSAAAEDAVKACAHPEVTDVARAVLNAIARLIPEGDTTTPLIGMGALATLAHVDRRTVWTWLPVLVAIGEVRVVDGGQGRKARYTIVHLDGAPPITAVPLPLRADLQPVRRRVTLPEDTTGDLFDPPIVRSESEELVITRITSWPARTITRITSWALSLVIAIARITSWRLQRTELVIGTCDPCDPTCDPTLPLDVDDARARDVHTFKNTHTSRDGPDPSAEEPPPRIPVHPWHAWCGPVVCVPKELHDDWLRKGHDAVWLFAFYARRYAEIPVGAKITVNDFTFWRAALKAELGGSAPATRASPETQRTNLSRRELDDARTIRDRVYGRCPHEDKCTNDVDCVRRIALERKAG